MTQNYVNASDKIHSFDLDGTLVDSPIDFNGMRKSLGITKRQDILIYLDSIKEKDPAGYSEEQILSTNLNWRRLRRRVFMREFLSSWSFLKVEISKWVLLPVIVVK